MKHRMIALYLNRHDKEKKKQMIGDAAWLLSSGREMEQDVPDHTGADRLWTQPDTSQRSKGNTLASAALWFAQCEMRILFVRVAAASGHPSGRDCGPSPRGPLELRLHSGCLQGGLLIACSSTNWFSARSEPEWQGVKGGISCFCIYNSVASCVYVCVPKSVYLEKKWRDTHLLIYVCCPIIIFGEERKVQHSVFTAQQSSPTSPINNQVIQF